MKFPAAGERAPPVPPVIVEMRTVPGVIDPVRVAPAPEKAKTPVPNTLTFPAEGTTAPPELPVRVFIVPEETATTAHVATAAVTSVKI